MNPEAAFLKILSRKIKVSSLNNGFLRALLSDPARRGNQVK